MKKEIRGHQGDVQFRTSTLPKGAVKINNKPIAFGEHSGHQHVITGDVDLFEFEGFIYACVGSDGASLQHIHESHFGGDYKTKELIQKADHNHIKLEKGVYKFAIQNTYNPYSKLFEQVKD